MYVMYVSEIVRARVIHFREGSAYFRGKLRRTRQICISFPSPLRPCIRFSKGTLGVRSTLFEREKQ